MFNKIHELTIMELNYLFEMYCELKQTKYYDMFCICSETLYFNDIINADEYTLLVNAIQTVKGEYNDK